MKTILIIIGMILSPTAFSQNQNFWLIGGGNKITNSQEQIEKNVIWLEKILNAKGYNNKYKLYYGIGENPGNDTQYIDQLESRKNELSALQAVFTKNAQTGISYRRHNLTNTDGGTQKKTLLSSLTNDFKSVSNNSEITLIYNGHGGRNYNNETENYLKLWGDTKMTVSELSTALANTPDSSIIRFILPQCYSGGFYNLINPGKIIENPRICGFMSVSETKEAEGCTLETNSEEFRDYTTYFFAALNNADRNGKKLITNPDINTDEKVSYREAHLYTLKYAISKDISRSTSEVYLEKWLPWYLRWSIISDYTDSHYWTIAKEVAKHNSLSLGKADLNERYIEMGDIVNSQRSTTKNLEKKIASHQKTIIKKLKDKFPGMNLKLLRRQPDADLTSAKKANTYIISLPDYKQLISESDQYKKARINLLERERNLAQINKVHRFKKLSWIEKMFFRFSSDKEKNEYQALLDCENTGSL